MGAFFKLGSWQLLVVVMSLLSLSACTVVEVKPWQRNILAKPIMAGQPNPIQAGLRDHVFSSKEGSTGTASAGGGGCGCN